MRTCRVAWSVFTFVFACVFLHGPLYLCHQVEKEYAALASYHAGQKNEAKKMAELEQLPVVQA